MVVFINWRLGRLEVEQELGNKNFHLDHVKFERLIKGHPCKWTRQRSRWKQELGVQGLLGLETSIWESSMFT